MSRFVRALALCLLVGGVLSTGCQPSEPPLGEVVDTTGKDAGTTLPDAGSTGQDSGTPADAGSTGQDAGMTLPDAGSPDAGPTVTVLARVEVHNRKPDVMLLVDTSGSMTQPINPSLAGCKQADGGVCGFDAPCDTSRCPTRWSEVQGAMGSFLSQNPTLARLGLVTFPDVSSGDVCGSSSSIRVGLPSADDDATLGAKTSAVNTAIQDIPNHDPAGKNMPQGGTPTAASLQFLKSIPELQTAEREDFVLLLTDGPPNCNPNHPTPYPSCQCTLGVSFACESSPYDRIGCLDDTASVKAIQELGSRGIRTIVVGFGSEVVAPSWSMTPYTLSVMANAGGFEYPCRFDNDCNVGNTPGTCDTSTNRCKRQFYPASTGAQLATVLQFVGGKLVKDPCLVRLERAWYLDPEDLQVALDGQVVSAAGPDSWSLTEEGVRFTGSVCQKLQAATAAPVVVEVRALQGATVGGTDG